MPDQWEESIPLHKRSVMHLYVTTPHRPYSIAHDAFGLCVLRYWSMSERMTSTLVCDALQMALFRRQWPRGVIVHSDRGSQYCSKEHRKLLADNSLLCSMSAKGNCYDNAMGSWNHSLKVEAIHGEKLRTRVHTKAHVFDYIEVYYNRQHLHSKLGYLNPAEFELTKTA